MVELIWDGKYDEDGQRAAPLRVALPFQTVETVNESAQQRQMSLESLLSGRDQEWRNRLIWGDKKYVLPSLLPEFAGQVDLIYIDPPFATGQDFSFQAQVGDEKFTKEPSIIEQKAYRDTWSATKGIARLRKYLPWIYETVVFLYELLSETGCIYLHCDPTVSHYIKPILDELFGYDKFQNEVIWSYPPGGKGPKYAFHRKHDVVFAYSRGDSPVFHRQYKPLSDYAIGKFTKTDADGRKYKEYRGKTRTYLDQVPGTPVSSVWTDIYSLGQTISRERLGYPTQKPESLLERIIRASSNEGDLVLDCFCGSGTTPAVAEKLKRRWIACDLGRFAIHTSRKRLLGIENVRPFVVQNLGKYERQVWQKAEFGAEAAAQLRAYRHFILALYHAEPLDGYQWLHGRKGKRLAHVGSVDSPIAEDDARQIALEVRRAAGGAGAAGVDVLGWDFALDMNETAQQIAAQAGIDLRFLRIPREVLEPKAVEQGDIRFFELAALDVAWTVQNRELSIELTDFMAPPDDVPDDVRAAVHSWEDWIDYWAVDFDYRDDAFHNQWQSYRARKDRSLLLRVNHKYSAPGDYVVMVKVIDILGNDTTKTITVQVE